jgi:geranylgeranyl diphosphate synthase, type I
MAAILAPVMAKSTADLAGVPAGSFRDLVDLALEDFLLEQRRRVEALAPDATVLLDELESLLAAGGKRLRPLFCLMGYRAGGGTDEHSIARAGAAIELLHTSAVIHDDVLDRSILRRGQPTTYRRLGGEEPAFERFGRDAAVLAGDLAQALADDLLARSGFPPDRLQAAFLRFNEMRLEAVAGEFVDVLSARRRDGGEATARRVARLKSGSYSVVGPLLIGAELAGAGAGVLETIAAYGRPLGEAFQLRDDVLGTFGDPSRTGKDRDTDIREGKQTALVAKARQLADEPGRRLLADRLGHSDISSEEVESVRAVIRDSGALAQTVALIDSLAVRAKSALAGAPVAPDVVEGLFALADLVALRDA